MSGTAVTTGGTTPGYYGKVPTRGDFLSRNLPREFLTPWDAWLQQALSGSRDTLGETWLNCYLTSPLWRFALGPGVCGSQAMTGVLMPSVDRVGRYFPLSLAIPLAPPPVLLDLPQSGTDWYTRAETLLLEALEDELDLDDFSKRVKALGQPPYIGERTARPPPTTNTWHLELDAPDALDAARELLLDQLFRQRFPSPTLWWTSGSELIRPCLLISQGLPPPTAFAGLLAGDWSERDWSLLSTAAVAPESTSTEDSP